MLPIRVGQIAPDLTLQTIDGQPVLLSSAWGNGRNALLIFLRHLAWLPWQEHVAQVVPFSAEIATLKTNIVAISFGTPYWANAWLTKTAAPFPIWLDPNKQSYPTYGLQRSALASWGPKNLWFYAKALARGTKLENTGEDVTQLGGNFIVDASGIVRFAHPSKNPTDRPTSDQLLSLLRSLP